MAISDKELQSYLLSNSEWNKIKEIKSLLSVSNFYYYLIIKLVIHTNK
jgi:hypothetical protein